MNTLSCLYLPLLLAAKMVSPLLRGSRRFGCTDSQKGSLQGAHLLSLMIYYIRDIINVAAPGNLPTLAIKRGLLSKSKWLTLTIVKSIMDETDNWIKNALNFFQRILENESITMGLWVN